MVERLCPIPGEQQSHTGGLKRETTGTLPATSKRNSCAAPKCRECRAACSKKFRESVFEIFSNSVIHSQTRLGIFSCGQYFPKRNRLDFSVADLGIGIRENVLKHTGLDLNAADAIAWATDGQNTTKRGNIPGGLGLKLLKEFITLNAGRIQIVSASGYWALESGKVITKEMLYEFSGTVVNIEIDTADKRSYKLSSEISEKDIF